MQLTDLMEKFEDVRSQFTCKTNCAEIDVSRIVFDAGLRQSCEMNDCGAYGKNYMCPPFCGEIHELIDKAKKYQKGFVFQSIHELEDSFDIENMEKGSLVHNQLVLSMGQYARMTDPGCLVLGAGGCRNCSPCAAVKGEACRFPEKAFPSLEAYGVFVSKLAQACGLRYINGVNTVTYFGMVLYNPA